MTDPQKPLEPVALDVVLNRFDAPLPSADFEARTLAAMRSLPQRRSRPWTRLLGWKALLFAGMIGGGGLAAAASGLLWRSSGGPTPPPEVVQDHTASTRTSTQTRPVAANRAPAESLDLVWIDLSPSRLAELEAVYDLPKREQEPPISAGAASELRALAGAPRLDRPRFEAFLDRNGVRLPRRPLTQRPVAAGEVDVRSTLEVRRLPTETLELARDRTRTRTGSAAEARTVERDLARAVAVDVATDVRSQVASPANVPSLGERVTNREDAAGPARLENLRPIEGGVRPRSAGPPGPELPARPGTLTAVRPAPGARIERPTRPPRPERPERPPRVARPGRE